MSQVSSPIQNALSELALGHDLDARLMEETMTQIMAGEADPAAIGGLLMALRIKGECVSEIAAAARVMRKFATSVSIDCDRLTDIVGTGGDGAATFNVSTASAFVAASAGVVLAKHGNRSVSSRSGAADLLEAAGCRLDIGADEVQKLINAHGIAFLFAPQHHGAMRHAIGPRKALGIWSLFNLLGPLTNPAGARCQVLGVFAKDRVLAMAEVMRDLGAQHVMVVSSQDGLDEISPVAPTYVAELKEGEIQSYEIHPEDFGLAVDSLEGLAVDGPEASLNIVREVLSGQADRAARAIVALNAGAAIYVGGQADSYSEGVALAQKTIDQGSAWSLLERYAHATQQVGQVD